MYVVVQLCCFSCNKFIDIYLCYDKDYFKFIKKINDYENFSYIIYNLDLIEISRLDFTD